MDPALLAAAPTASDPNPFFRALLRKPYLQQVVISPHLYPPSVAGGTGADIWKQYSPETLWKRFSKCAPLPPHLGVFHNLQIYRRVYRTATASMIYMHRRDAHCIAI